MDVLGCLFSVNPLSLNTHTNRALRGNSEDSVERDSWNIRDGGAGGGGGGRKVLRGRELK